MVFAHCQFETDLWSQGHQYVVGIDEVGRGAWAGPLVIGAVIFPTNSCPNFPLADSKQLSPKKRAKLIPQITSCALAHAIIEVSVQEINEIGVGKACQKGFQQAVKSFNMHPDFVLIDAFKIVGHPLEKQNAIIKGDEQSVSIAAASILAKEYRDNLMRDIHSAEPRFCFDKNVGYGTKDHRAAIGKHGLSTYHRTSYDLGRWLNLGF
jgi:ribonuclease HII